ncbi:MAG: penicillin-binding protein 2 [Fimbriimonadaceae bacterium]|nr:penicillin-binding protein 2 [Fimbriimonadaceae bacterium]
MSVIHAPREPELDARHGLFPALLLAAFVVLLIRLWYLQVVAASDLSERAQYFQRVSVSQLAPRGLIYDRNGTVLASVEPRVVISARPAVVRQNPWVIDKVAAMLATDPEQLREKVKAAAWRPYLPAPIHIGASIEVATRIAEAGSHLPGIEVSTQPMRAYTDTLSLAHVLGYVWTPNGDDVKRLADQELKAAPYVGKLGIERVYEKYLMGEPGSERFEVDAKRRPTRTVGRDSPVPGERLILSIDYDLQRLAVDLLKGNRGAIVALDPRTGEVLCLASSPSYDAAMFEGGISQKDWKQLNDDPGHPMINRAIGTYHAPGSTFKIVTTLAAMRAGVFDPNRTVYCPGYYQVGNRRSKCLGHHGTITFERAFEKSCNTYFSDLAMRAGKDVMRETALLCGLGTRTGIDLIGETPGVVPTDEWLARWRDPVRWYPGDTVNLAIGQGEVSATALQMAFLASVVANRGIGYRPHLLRARQEPGNDGKLHEVQPEVAHEVDGVSADGWARLTRAMGLVISDGTARAAQIPGIEWGGKTGSAERRGQQMTDSWFVGLAPLEAPRIVVCVSVENVGHGSDFAAPFARDIVRRYLLGKPASASPKAETEVSATPASSERPSSR